MILELDFNGYKFFEDGSKISFSPDERTKKLLSNAVEIDNKNVLKAISLYGPNNSGKTNIVRLFKYIKNLFGGASISEINNLEFGDQNVVDISITFNNNDGNGWFKYDFCFDNVGNKFVREKLSSVTFYKKGSPFYKLIFERNFIEKRFELMGEDESIVFQYISAKEPLLYSLELESGKYSILKPYIDVFKKFAASIEIVRMYNIQIQNTINALKEGDQEKKDFIVSFVKSSDLSVQDFYYDNGGMEREPKIQINEGALKYYETISDTIHLKTMYGNKPVLSLIHDSSGTKKIQAIASYIYDAIADGKTLVVDEMDNGLHFQLTRAIVGAFNNIANKTGQLVFSAHDLMLIDCNFLMRKDQIYFIERQEEKAQLFCLKDFPVAEGGPREGTELVRRYKHGDFGRMPVPNFTKEVLKISNRRKANNG